MDYILYKNSGNHPSLSLSCSDMEWILNALRGAQEEQLNLAQEMDGKKLTAADITAATGAVSSTPDAALDLGKDLFQPQYHHITQLREDLVKLCGHDLTDDGC